MNPRQMNAWMYDGGGMQLMREFYRHYNIIAFPCANTAAQIELWRRAGVGGRSDSVTQAIA
jgi:TRAP-type mannitol/chloroaromatic compound transport system substrate-binding protein